MRDAAYEGLPYRRRRQLHARVGSAILASSGGDHAEHAELLSLHFFLAEDDQRAQWYSEVAAERAESAFANVEASRFFRRAIDAGRRVGCMPAEIARLSERLGDTLERAGLYEDAGRPTRRRARPTARPDRGVAADAQAGQAGRQGRQADVVAPLARPRAPARGGRVGAQAAAEQRARLSAQYSSVRAGQGKGEDAIRWAERAIAEAEEVGELDALANAHYMIGWTRVNQGELGQADHFERALEIFEETGDVLRQSDVLNYHGAMAYWEGRWGTRGPVRARPAARRAGGRRHRRRDRLGEHRRKCSRIRDGSTRRRAPLGTRSGVPRGPVLGAGVRRLADPREEPIEERAPRGGRDPADRGDPVAEDSACSSSRSRPRAMLAEDLVGRGEPKAALERLAPWRSRPPRSARPASTSRCCVASRPSALMALGTSSGEARLEKSLRSSRRRFGVRGPAGARGERLLADAGRDEASASQDAEASSIRDRLGIVAIPAMLPSVVPNADPSGRPCARSP